MLRVGNFCSEINVFCFLWLFMFSNIYLLDGELFNTKKTRRPGSVLDSNREGKAMLEIMGKVRHSEGFREPVSEEDE
jgi:hypothetical protein